MHFVRTLIVLLVASVGCSNAAPNDGSLATSVAGMVQQLQTERVLIEILNKYASELQQKVDTIRSAVSSLRKESQKSLHDPEDYLGNPINAFALIRRMHEDWHKWALYLTEAVGGAQIEELASHLEEMPKEDDLQEAVNAIERLRYTYDLKAGDMSVGLLNGKQYDVKFSSADCFAIGYRLFLEESYHSAGYWLYSAQQLHQDSAINRALNFKRVKILELYAEALLRQERIKDALQVIEIALQSEPANLKLLSSKGELEWKINTEKARPPITFPPFGPSAYELGCRGTYSQKLSNLHCLYNTTTTPFLKLAPIKMEIVSLDPYMVLYHDIIYDSEIDELQRMARPDLKRATVFSEVQNKSVVVNRRTSKFAWLYDNTNAMTARLNKRITDMTGFDLTGSEMLQVMNYGMGGHYDTHYDFFNASRESDVVRTNGDRISTVLFYLTDVDQGGATVFPNIEKSIHPVKGTAVMWYNLNNRGDVNSKTLHAACPVLVGSKWVCNKWIREKQQIFRRPCY